ncbi:MAG: PH domain-containing protein [Verrucomicrobiae bacterium]|nr:PH domain-containing protein [Verrucomicrobiae bacterium]
MSEVEATAAEPMFSILKRGERDPWGPYSQDDLLALLNGDKISIHDYVYYDGIGEWKPIHEVFDVQEEITHFIDDGQDTQRVGIAFREVSNVVGPGESIYYIAVQAKVGLLSKTKQCVIVTDRHLFILTETRKGYELEAHPWKSITNTLMRDEGKGLGTFSILLGGERRTDIPHIPLKQVQRLFQLSQEMRGSVSL